jgi:hypothetical protein
MVRDALSLPGFSSLCRFSFQSLNEHTPDDSLTSRNVSSVEIDI